MTARISAAAALWLLTASAALAGTVIIIDGDTIDIDGTRIRIVAIDTPETFRSRCERELILGLAAKQRLRELLDSGPVTFTPQGLDRYRRTLARVFVDGVDVGDVLLREGFALAYIPGPRAKAARLATWCGS
jgi:endonuclease YncB( thermonuclease family)